MASDETNWLVLAVTALSSGVMGAVLNQAAQYLTARYRRPRLALIFQKDEDGCEVCRKLTAVRDPPSVILISSRAAADYGPRINTCGARGFLEKAELTAAALRAVVR